MALNLNMNKKNIFSEPIIYNILKKDELDNEILKELEKEESLNKGVVYSNQGGFQTNIINNKKISSIIFNNFLKCLKNYFKFKKNCNVVLKNVWINKNKKGDFNIPHVHPDSNFSGIYYLKTSKEGGFLSFIKNDSVQMTNNHEFLDDIDINVHTQIKPRDHLFIIFPSYLLHMVTPHFEEDHRISVAFNVKFENV